MKKRRYKIKIRGIVQGVGFRPFVYNLAVKNSLKGYVLNSSDGVVIDVEGNEVKIKNFIVEVKNNAPVLAVIDSVEINNVLRLANYDSFEIKESNKNSNRILPVSPDIAICKDCLNELFNKSDRRYNYPFINCTNCGPRFTIIYKVPYDRQNTTMKYFKICSDCQKEYDDPTNRRFHAQPDCCWECGPKLELWKSNSQKGSRGSHELNSGQALDPAVIPLYPPLEKGEIPLYPPLLKGGLSLGDLLGVKEPISTVIKFLKEGFIVAIKGIGGFHLACDAKNDNAVNNLRKRKLRTFKPFAVMMKNIEIVKKHCFCSDEERELLLSSRAPIVLLRKRVNTNIPMTFLTDFSRVNNRYNGATKVAKKTLSSISPLVAPNNNYLGVILPYSPLHHILFRDTQIDSLVMTSANFSEEPITIDNEEAISKISKIADFILLNNRDINLRCDDSVVMDVDGPIILRRSRGYAPQPLYLQINSPGILAVGAELKNTFCISKGNFYFLSQHIGDMENIDAYKFFDKSIKHFINFFNIKPIFIAHDLHPDYISTNYAYEHRKEVKKLIPVQHHHAHIASCMAENGIDEKVIGVAFDGTGYGTDGNIWGGEFMVCDYVEFDRVGHFSYIPLPGGDLAVKNNYRMAISYLYQIFGDSVVERFPKLLSLSNKSIVVANFNFHNPPIPPFNKGGIKGEFKIGDYKQYFNKIELNLICKQLKNKINVQLTSSCGRLFDAVSSILGIRHKVTYDAQAAIELEMIAEHSKTSSSYDIIINKVANMDSRFHGNDISNMNNMRKDGYLVDTVYIIKQILSDIEKGEQREDISAKFHNTIVKIILEMCNLIYKEKKIKKVVLSGGVFQNRILLRRSINLLKESHFEVFINRKVPPNDGGIPLGQSVIAAKMLKMSW